MTGDLRELYFLSTRSGTQLLYVATRNAVTDPWSAPVQVVELDTDGINNAKVSNDGLSMVFSSSRLPNAGAADIWLATRPDRTGMWTPSRVDELATAVNDIEPWLMTSDALTLYFSSARDGNTTLYTATRESVGVPFGNIMRLDELNSNSYDGSPWVDAREQYMVFHSARANSYDFYETRRAQPSGPWMPPLPITELNNDVENESDAWISPDGHTMLFTSDHDGTDDIYMATR